MSQFVLEHLEYPIQTECANYQMQRATTLVIQIDIGESEPYEVWTVNGEVVENFANEKRVDS